MCHANDAEKTTEIHHGFSNTQSRMSLGLTSAYRCRPPVHFSGIMEMTFHRDRVKITAEWMKCGQISGYQGKEDSISLPCLG